MIARADPDELTLSQRAADQAEARARVALARARERLARDALRLRSGRRAGEFGHGAGSYDATRTHRLQPRIGQHRAATVESHLDRDERERQIRIARDLMRNRPIAQAMVNRVVDLEIGPGFTPQATTADEDWNRAAEEVFGAWAEDPASFDVAGVLDLTEHLRVIERQAIVDGDVAVLRLSSGQVQLIEAERVVNPNLAPNSENLINGVEIDLYGRPIAYHVADFDRSGTYIDPKSGRWHPASAVELILRPEWSSQRRGEPRLASVADDLARLDDYIESTEEAAHIATMFAAFTRTRDPWLMAEQLGGDLQTHTTEAGDQVQRREVELERGVIGHLEPGEDVVQVKPEHPTTVFDEFCRMRMRMIGVRLDLPLELALLDFSVSNFHGALAAIDVAWTSVESRQRWLIGYLRRLWRWRIARAINAGDLELRDDWDRVSWTPPARPNLDPSRKAKTDREEIAGNLKTLRAACAERGRDWRDVLDQRRLERDLEREYDVEPPVTPGSLPQDTAE